MNDGIKMYFGLVEVRTIGMICSLMGIAFVAGLSLNLSAFYFDLAWLVFLVFNIILLVIGLSFVLLVFYGLFWSFAEWKGKRDKWKEVMQFYYNYKDKVKDLK